jgi:hypothetical protein
VAQAGDQCVRRLVTEHRSHHRGDVQVAAARQVVAERVGATHVDADQGPADHLAKALANGPQVPDFLCHVGRGLHAI